MEMASLAIHTVLVRRVKMASSNEGTCDPSAEDGSPMRNSTSTPQLTDDASTLTGSSPPLEQNQTMHKASRKCSYPHSTNSKLTFK